MFNTVDTRNLESEEVKSFNFEKNRCFRLCYKINKTNPFCKRYTKLVNKLFEYDIMNDNEIRQPLHIANAKNMVVGKGVFINYNFSCIARQNVTIEDNVYIGPNVSLFTSNHDFIDHKIIHSSPIHICKNVWIAANVIVLPGVTIGENAVIGAGSVVTKDVKPFTVVAGNPAKYIKEVEH